MPHDSFYTSRQWRDARGKYLRLNPWCQVCTLLRLQTRAAEVDHIIAINKGGAPLDPRNFRGLCKRHHSQKTGKLDSRQAAPVERWVITGEDGYPIHIEKGS